MNGNLLKSILLFISLISFSYEGWAYMTSGFDANIGQSSIIAKTASEQKTIDSLSSIELNYTLRKSSQGIAYALSFFEMLNSKEGALAFTRISVGPRWYPIGMNGNKLLIDNDVVAKIWKATPFLGGSFGIANLSTENYNASLLDLGFRVGVEIPLSPSLLLNFQYNMSQSLSGSSKSPESAISYSGNSAMIGLLISGVGD